MQEEAGKQPTMSPSPNTIDALRIGCRQRKSSAARGWARGRMTTKGVSSSHQNLESLDVKHPII
uniref:Uncharacterized protein n=1 Tax=Oryza sativa subsp. japonica TaxID=39947 RepID=Q5Z5J4_ORYSJ|nr:hypothetical protein [Oryza sativa Japonica Group]